MIFDYELDAVDIFEEEVDPVHGFVRHFSEFISPNRSVSNIGPEFVDCLELNLGKLKDYVVLTLLEYALRDCINLQYLKVEIREHPNQKNSELDGNQNKLKMVRFLAEAPTNCLFDETSTLLPDIEVLVLGSHGSYDKSFDLTQFKSLKRCYLIIQQSFNYICCSTAVKFEYKNGKRQRYYYDGKVKKLLVTEDTTSYPCRSFTFTCEKDIEFYVCFESDENLSKFDIDKSQGNCYRIPTNII